MTRADHVSELSDVEMGEVFSLTEHGWYLCQINPQNPSCNIHNSNTHLEHYQLVMNNKCKLNSSHFHTKKKKRIGE